MSLQGRILIFMLGVALLALVINLVRTQRLHAGFGVVWLGATMNLMVLVAFPSLLDLITKAMGAIFPASALSLLAFVFIFVVLIFISVQLSRLSTRQVEMAQYLAMREVDEERIQQPSSQKENGE
jgi:hypothetical protein